jgi:hypothetical protein
MWDVAGLVEMLQGSRDCEVKQTAEPMMPMLETGIGVERIRWGRGDEEVIVTGSWRRGEKVKISRALP